MSDLRHDEVRTLNRMLSDLDCAELSQMITEITAQATTLVTQSKARLKRMETVIELDMLYLGQSHLCACADFR